jgi:hypothetical protein
MISSILSLEFKKKQDFRKTLILPVRARDVFERILVKQGGTLVLIYGTRKSVAVQRKDKNIKN